MRVIDAAELSPEELSHLFPQGYTRLPDKISKELVMKPAELIVHEYHTAVYVSNRNEAGNTEFAYGPSHGKLFGSNSIASPELIAGYMTLVKASTKHRAKGSVSFDAHQRIQAIYHVDNMYKDLDPED